MHAIQKATALGVAAAVAAAAQASAATLTVDDDQRQCTSPYTSIQSAIDAAKPGDRVLVCDGTYREALDIGAGKDRLKIVAEETRGSVIQTAPSMMGPPAPEVVHIHGGVTGVQLNRFVIQGPGFGGQRRLVLVDEGAVVRSMRNNTFRVARNNFLDFPSAGVRIGGPADSPSAGTVKDLSRNRFENYTAAGIRVIGAGSSAVISHNHMAGVGDQPFLNNNGIRVTDGAVSRITGNRITGHAGPPLAISGRYVGGYGIRLEDAGPGTIVNNNYVDDNVYGIGLAETSDAFVRSNEGERNGTGIEVDEASTDNTFRSNGMAANRVVDCVDNSVGTGTAGTANLWIDNAGDESVPNGLCTGGDDD